MTRSEVLVRDKRNEREPMTSYDYNRLAIRDLVDDWVVYRDAGDWDRFRGAWHPNGRMMATWFQGTVDEFIEVSFEGKDVGEEFELTTLPRPVGTCDEQEYLGSGTVLENQHHGPQLCLEPVMTSQAEAAMRTVWKGALCISEAKYTEAELRKIQDEAPKAASGLALTTSSGDDRVDLEVIVDEGGRLQKQLDVKYGTGTVRVSSALVEASPGM